MLFLSWLNSLIRSWRRVRLSFDYEQALALVFLFAAVVCGYALTAGIVIAVPNPANQQFQGLLFGLVGFGLLSGLLGIRAAWLRGMGRGLSVERRVALELASGRRVGASEYQFANLQLKVTDEGFELVKNRYGELGCLSAVCELSAYPYNVPRSVLDELRALLRS